MRKLIAQLGFALVLFSPAVFAEVSEAEVAALREQVRILTERLDLLEQKSRQADAALPSTQPVAEATPQDDPILDEKIDQAVAVKIDEEMVAVSWAERMRWSGDFRYRYETIAEENNPDRNRNRIRARILMQADVSDTMQVGIGLASGSDDPVSTNQTLGGGGSHKPISLDLAYFEWSGLSDTRILGGKFKNELYRAGGNAMLWDSDWRPEGATLVYDDGTLFALGLGSWLESDSNKPQQEFSYGAQAGIHLQIGTDAKLTAGAGYYHVNSAGKGSFYGDDDFFGNSYDPVSGTYLYNYYEVEGFAQVDFHLLDYPTTLFADYVHNLDADENNTGYALGFQFGAAKAKGTWQFGYTYEKLEADAVFGLVTDSDFGGGGTNAKGSIFTGAYAFHDNWNFATTYFLNQVNIDSGDSDDYNRLQLDLNFKFK